MHSIPPPYPFSNVLIFESYGILQSDILLQHRHKGTLSVTLNDCNHQSIHQSTISQSTPQSTNYKRPDVHTYRTVSKTSIQP
eukprot:167641-Amphidinium_carterae.1